MKITGFRPLIITAHADEVIAVFEALGFERKHQKNGINDQDISAVALKDANGFRVNVVRADMVPQDMTSIAMNVDNLDEAVAFLTEHGFKNVMNAQGGTITDTGSSRALMMVSPSGFSISVSQHIKD